MANMKTSNYPNGFRNGVNIQGMPVLNSYGGKVLWVDSGAGHDATGQGTYNLPYATIDYAIGKCTASNGDVIMVKAGHAETLTAAGDITCDKAGVTIMAAPGAVGSLMPKLTFSSDDNTASVVISAANVSIIGILGVCNDDGLANPFNISGADCFLDIEWHDGSNAIEAASVVVTTAAADRLSVNLKYLGYTSGSGATTPVKLTGCNDGRINVDFYGLANTAVVNFATTCTNIEVTGYFYNESAALTKNVVDSGSSTWFAHGWDGKGGYSFSGGSAAALAADDIATVSSQATSIATGVVSLGTQVTAVASQATSIATGTVSVGTQATGVASQATSIATGVVSVGTQTTGVASQATSIATGTVSIGTQATAIASQTTSIATGVVSVGTQVTAVASQATSIATGMVSVGTQATAVASQATSIATGVVSVGTQVTAVASQATSIATGVAATTSQATSIATGVVSVGTQTTAVASQATSVATGMVSVGTQTTAVASQTSSIATGLALVYSMVLSHVS